MEKNWSFLFSFASSLLRMVFDTHVTHTLHRASWPCTQDNFDKLKRIISVASDKNTRLVKQNQDLLCKLGVQPGMVPMSGSHVDPQFLKVLKWSMPRR